MRCDSRFDTIKSMFYFGNRQGLSTLQCRYCTIASKINATPKGVRLSEKLHNSVTKFDCDNKFDLCYYGHVNSLRLE